MQLFKRPPNTLHVFFVHGFVGIIHIYPATNPINRIVPQTTGLHHIFTRSRDVLFQANRRTDSAAIFNA